MERNSIMNIEALYKDLQKLTVDFFIREDMTDHVCQILGDIHEEICQAIQQDRPLFDPKFSWFNTYPSDLTSLCESIMDYLFSILLNMEWSLVNIDTLLFVEIMCKLIITFVPYLPESVLFDAPVLFASVFENVTLNSRLHIVDAISEYFIPMISIQYKKENSNQKVLEVFSNRILTMVIGKLQMDLKNYLKFIESLMYWMGQDILQILLNLVICGNENQRNICLRIILHYYSPKDESFCVINSENICKNVICYEKDSPLNLTTWDPTSSLEFSLTPPPLSLCSICSSKINIYSKMLTFNYLQPIRNKTLIIHDEKYSVDDSFCICCQTEGCKNSAEFLSSHFNFIENGNNKNYIYSNEVMFVGVYLCNNCHQSKEHKQCQYIFSSSKNSSSFAYFDELMADNIIMALSKTVDNLDDLTGMIALEKDNGFSLQETLVVEVKNLFYLEKLLGFFIFYKDSATTVKEEIIQTTYTWKLRPSLDKIKNSIHHLVWLLNVSFKVLVSKEIANVSDIDPNLLLNITEWLKILKMEYKDIFTSSFKPNFKLDNSIIRNNSNRELIIHIIIGMLTVIKEQLLRDMLDEQSWNEIIFDILTVILQEQINYNQLSVNFLDSDDNTNGGNSLKINIKEIFLIAKKKFAIIRENNGAELNFLHKILQNKENHLNVLFLLGAFRLLSICGLSLELSKIALLIKVITEKSDQIISLNQYFSAFLFKRFSETESCFICFKSKRFVIAGLVKGFCCISFRCISQEFPLDSEAKRSCLSYLCADLLLQQLVEKTDEVSVERKLDTNSCNCVIELVISFIHCFSLDGRFPIDKSVNRMLCSTILYILTIIIKQNPNMVESHYVNSFTIDYPDIPISDEPTELEQLCITLSKKSDDDPMAEHHIEVKLGIIAGFMLFQLCLEDEYHDSGTANCLITTISSIFLVKNWLKQYLETEAGQAVLKNFILPSIWTCQKMEDYTTSVCAIKFMQSFIDYQGGFSILIEEITKYVQNVLKHLTTQKASAHIQNENTNIHMDTSNLELLEQMAVCVMCLCVQTNVCSNGNYISFMNFVVTYLVLLGNSQDSYISCLSVEFLKKITDTGKQIILECLYHHFESVPEDRILLLMLANSLSKLINIKIPLEKLVNWLFLSFPSITKKLAEEKKVTVNKSDFKCHQISTARAFADIQGFSLSSPFRFPENFEEFNILSDKPTYNHSFFAVFCKYILFTLTDESTNENQETFELLKSVLSCVISGIDNKAKKYLFCVPFGTARMIFLENAYEILDKRPNNCSIFVSIVLENIIKMISHSDFYPMPHMQNAIDNGEVKLSLSTPDTPIDAQLASLLPDIRTTVLKIFYLILYKFDVQENFAEMETVISAVQNLLDGHMHICRKTKASEQNNDLKIHITQEMTVCKHCGIMVFMLDEHTLNRCLLIICEFHIHNLHMGTKYFLRTLLMLYKFIYYGAFNQRYMGLSETKGAGVSLPTPQSSTATASRILYQLFTIMEPYNLALEFLIINHHEPFAMFHSLVYAFITNADHDEVLRFLIRTIEKVISVKDEFSQSMSEILENLTFFIFSIMNIILSRDTFSMSSNILKFRQFLPQLNTNVIYGLETTLSLSDKISITADLMMRIVESCDNLLKHIVDLKNKVIIPYNVCAVFVRYLIAFNGPTCFYYKNMVSFVELIFSAPVVSVIDAVQIAIQWYLVSIEKNDKFLLMGSLIKQYSNKLVHILVKPVAGERIYEIVAMFLKICGSNGIFDEDFNIDDTKINEISLLLETIPNSCLFEIMQINVSYITKATQNLYTSSEKVKSNKRKKGLIYRKRMNVVRLPLAQILAVTLSRLTTTQIYKELALLYPWYKSVEHKCSNLRNLEDSVSTLFELKDCVWILLGAITHGIEGSQGMIGNPPMNYNTMSKLSRILISSLNVCMLSSTDAKKLQINKIIHIALEFVKIFVVYGEMFLIEKNSSDTIRSQLRARKKFSSENLWDQCNTMIINKLGPLTKVELKGGFAPEIVCLDLLTKTMDEVIGIGFSSPLSARRIIQPWYVKVRYLRGEDTDEKELEEFEIVNFDDTLKNNVEKFKYWLRECADFIIHLEMTRT